MRAKNRQAQKRIVRVRRHRRVRARISGTAAIPRLSVYRSLKHIWAQLIDDEGGRTLAAASDTELKGKKPAAEGKSAKTAAAFAVGELIAKKAHEKGITSVVFDRGGFAYHGRVAAVAEGARTGGLKF